jgi:C-terminal processing protease CtpA/Prc
MSIFVSRRFRGFVAACLAAMLLAASPVLAAPLPDQRGRETETVTREEALGEIYGYLSEMTADELAATLKLLRVRKVVNSYYVDGKATGGFMVPGAVKGALAALDDPYSEYLDAAR